MYALHLRKRLKKRWSLFVPAEMMLLAPSDRDRREIVAARRLDARRRPEAADPHGMGVCVRRGIAAGGLDAAGGRAAGAVGDAPELHGIRTVGPLQLIT